MRPILFSVFIPAIGSIDFPAYVTFLLIGFVLGIIFVVRTSNVNEFSSFQICWFSFCLILWGMVGSRLLHVIADGHLTDYLNLCLHPERVKADYALVTHCFNDQSCGFHYLCDPSSHHCYPPRDCLLWLEFWRPGLAYYGGFLLATGFAWVYCWRNRVSFLKVADMFASAISLGLFFGRLGCFFQGCCFGKCTLLPWGVRFPKNSDSWKAQWQTGMITIQQNALPVHPTQLYEALGCLIIFLILLLRLRTEKKKAGQTVGLFLVLYGVLRFLCEIFRDDERGILWGFLSTSQLLSIPLVVLGSYFFFRNKNKAI